MEYPPHGFKDEAISDLIKGGIHLMCAGNSIKAVPIIMPECLNLIFLFSLSPISIMNVKLVKNAEYRTSPQNCIDHKNKSAW